MKRIAIFVVMAMMAFTASARSVHYFTHSQAVRTVNYLNAQNEMMIYCGFDYEIETYVLINEVWMERVNSAYYEIWVYGYDAYTGDEIYMPLDLQCVWLFSGSRIYNAAQYLRFHVTVNQPTFVWHIPAYRPFVRVIHSPSYARTYHYTIHRHGWMPPAPPAPGYSAPLPPYYMRRPSTPAPTPTAVWTPGKEQPRVSTPTAQPSRDAGTSSTRNVTTTPSTNSSTATPASSSSTRSASTSNTSRATTTTPSRSSASATSGSTATPSRSTATPSRSSASTTPTRSNTSSRSSATSTTTSAPPSTTRSSATATSTRSTTSTAAPSPTTARKNATSTSRATTTESTSSSRSAATPSSSTGSSSTRSASSSRNATATRNSR
ncbi:MAG: hypothetical protein J6I49_07695 [Bacteroidales bacterium]|nr:hypothetical protein [Bacteroidales bacterium]